ncbi:mobilization protein [Planobispora rosea]|uniref:Mobilization protein n=1 Tax=Planobispora rosea TaxID=35762 RepID=A0A8J3S5W4_PLARO|nr:relaxase/mobilization nuclease domain-containing protein [Planobispora rosea]GGT04602.1 mobilization protein [Planobispora rosea]GIH88886.1 mobilization protein [Planobispora rosea]
MIAKAMYGSRTLGLLQYLFGPGTHEEHLDARLVASWDGMEPDPAEARRQAEAERARLRAQGRAEGEGPDPDGLLRAGLYQLAQHLDLPLISYGGPVPARHVWHTAVRAAPGDPWLSDEQWGQIARRIVAAAGVAPEGDEQACRWVAVRHADDHIHIVATLVRQDRSQPDLRGERYRLREECRAIEAEYGLRATAPADRSAAVRPTRAEQAKSHRVFASKETPREKLAAAVRQAAVAATSEQDFFGRLRTAGLEVKRRALPSGDLAGYAVAWPGDRTKDGKPVWFSGSRLAPDLSLPRVRQRWADVPAAGPAAAPDASKIPAAARPSAAQRREAAWRQAGEAVRAASAVLGRAGDEQGAAATAALADLLSAAAAHAPPAVRTELKAAARAFERAGRVPWQGQHAAARQMRGALRVLVGAGQALSSGDEGAAVLAFVVLAVLAARAVAARHRAAQRAAHAQAARVAASYLQGAAEHLGARSRARPDYRAAQRGDLQAMVGRAVAGSADARAILADAAWPALAGMLARVKAAGADPAAALQQVARQRALRTDAASPARSEAQVLTWRLEHWLADRALENDGAGARASARAGGRRPVGAPAGHPVATERGAAANARSASGKGRVRLRAEDSVVFQRAAVLVVQSQEVSSALLEKRLWVRPDKARELIVQLQERGFIVPRSGGGHRVVVAASEAAGLQAMVTRRASGEGLSRAREARSSERRPRRGR